MPEHLTQRDPASPSELQAQLESARRADSEADRAQAAEAEGVPVPQLDERAAAYQRTIERCATAVFLGVAWGLGKWNATLAQTIADSVHGASEELAAQVAAQLGGRFAVTFGMLAVVGALTEKAIRKQIATLHDKPKKPAAVVDLHNPAATESDS